MLAQGFERAEQTGAGSRGRGGLMGFALRNGILVLDTSRRCRCTEVAAKSKAVGG